MKYTLLTLLILLNSCGTQNDNVMEYVIPIYNEMYLKDSIKNAPYDYYAPNNVIIMDSSHKIYYHDNYTPCGTRWKVTNPPMKIDFEKSPLAVFENIDSLIERINQSEQPQKIIMIASNLDTIKNPLYFKIKSRIRRTKGMYEITRKITADEESAIKNNYSVLGKSNEFYR